MNNAQQCCPKSLAHA